MARNADGSYKPGCLFYTVCTLLVLLLLYLAPYLVVLAVIPGVMLMSRR